jgi:hypothetical protein
MKIFTSPAALCFAPMFMTVASAQTVSGDLVVNVSDPSRAVVAGSKLQLTQVETNIAQEPVADNLGNALYPPLKPGIYRLEVETAGFQGVEVDDIRVQAAATLLKAGSAACADLGRTKRHDTINRRRA